jgi:hypothetical protein
MAAVFALAAAFVPFLVRADVPQVYVQKVLVPSGAFAPGDTVSGTVYLANFGEEHATDISYVARVVGEYDENGFPLATYASKTFGPVFVPAGGGVQVDFNVMIPASVPEGEAGIEVQALLGSGLPLGWSDARIEVAGSRAPALSVVGAYLLVGAGDTTAQEDELFELQAGPTVAQGGHARLLIALLNEGDTELSFTPTSAVYDRDVETGKELARTPHERVALAPGRTVTLSLPLPMFDYAPGVYAGTLTFLADGNAEVLAPLPFRYIVGGDMAAIHAVSADKESLAQGEELLVTVLFSGPPYVIGSASLRQSAGALLAVALYDERDRQIAAASADIDLAQDGDVTVPLTAKRDAQALRADVSIVKDSAILAAVSVPLSALYDSMRVPEQALVSGTTLALIAALVAAALVIAYFAFYRRRTPDLPTPPSMGGSALALAFVVAAAAFAPSAAQAFTITDGCWLCINGFGPPELFVNTPVGVLQPGEKFYVTGTIRSLQCANRPQSIYLSSSFGGVSKNQSRGGGTYVDPNAWGANICVNFFLGGFCFPNPDYRPSEPDPLAKEIAENNYAHTTGVVYDVPWNGKWSHITDRFSMGPFYAPTTPGTYQVNVGGYWEEFLKDAHARGGVYGYQTFTVAAPPVECGTNQHESNGVCVCNQGFVSQGGTCVIPPPDTPDPNVGAGAGEGDGDDQGDDTTCPANEHAAGGSCVCNEGYARVNGSCVFQTQCSDGIDNDGNGLTDYPDDPGCSSPNDNDETIPDAELTVTPDKKLVKPGTAVVISWSAAHIVNGSCSLRGDNEDSWTLAAGDGGNAGGTQPTSKLVAETRYTLTCTSQKTDSPISASAVVKVVPSFNEF